MKRGRQERAQNRAGDPRLGDVVARALHGSWRLHPPVPEVSVQELDHSHRHLAATGAGGLVWRSIECRHQFDAAEARAQLQSAYRAQALQAALHARYLEQVLFAANSAGIEPLLVKGAAVASWYPHPGLRPYGDVDLVVPPSRLPDLTRALTSVPRPKFPVDVDVEHAFLHADGVPVGALMERSYVRQFGGATARIPSDEDMFRLLCLHFMRAAGRRGLSLVDIALMLERADGDFDWSIALPLDDAARRVTVATTAALAIQLLGADPSGTPFAERSPRVPEWVRQRVLTSFGAAPYSFLPGATFVSTLHPHRLVEQVGERWPPDPISVTVHHRRVLRSRSPLHLQFYDFGARIVVNALRAPREVRLRAAT